MAVIDVLWIVLGVWVLSVVVCVAGAWWNQRKKHHAARLEHLRQACLWYADQSHWQRTHFHGRRWYRAAAHVDAGTRARKALEGRR
jgi:hypothetical protein